MMHESALNAATHVAFQKMVRAAFLKKFYLAGGTALALQYGHRESVDLDFFCARSFKTESLIAALSKLGKFKLVNEEENTVDGILDGVKVSFFSYPYKLLRKTKMFEGVAVASVADIACMKINAIAGSTARKDFIDLFFIVEHEGWQIEDVLHLCNKKFGASARDPYHILKALCFFEEADYQPEVVTKPVVKWAAIKKFFLGEVGRMRKG
ncbi:MAG: nucleotidyl transferase AbiEii/AbiGii toxin family protein [Candidatus Magasanikbacteria bacterium]|nr:nucleotidyl transferase AbiEii/AbiGii toxin family protein [Candidatus Magasanikbacteria bacterium]